MTDAIRLPAELARQDELAALAHNDHAPRPAGWRLSPRAVETFILGSDRPLPYPVDGETREVTISRKFYGDDILVQRAIVTLASDRGLLLIGEPGTAKSWLSEHLAAAISGDSRLTVQGSAGLTEDQIKYGWNYALLLAQGPSREALVPAPLYTGMREGRVVRFEEITRAPHEVQDTLLSALSDKILTVPELPGDDGVVLARRGFNIIATANTRDRGVNEMSSALKRRFNFETVAPVDDLDEELRIVREQVGRTLAGGPAADVTLPDDVLELLVTTFHEIRAGRTLDGVKLERGGAVMSTAEAVSVGLDASLHAAFFGRGTVTPDEIVIHLAGTVLKDDPKDIDALRTYWDVAVKARAKKELGQWKAFHRARKHLGLTGS
ncbi:MAG: AAA family ATPase [Myxococcales bacterium]|nr:AAA family ATPase [Myxococcales bacterium]MCB9542660.1 AAA family ATPase [Myxococcales bacterium]